MNKYNSKNRWYLRIGIVYLILLICLLTSVYIFFGVTEPGYELLFVLPLVYGLFFSLVYSKILIGEFRVFFYIFIPVTFARYVLLPLLIVISGHYGGRDRKSVV